MTLEHQTILNTIFLDLTTIFYYLGASGAALFNSLYGFANGCENGLPRAGPPTFGLPPHMSLFYWPYPSPPISPNSFYGLHQQPTMVSRCP